MQYKISAVNKLPKCSSHNLMLYYIKRQFIYLVHKSSKISIGNLSYKKIISLLMVHNTCSLFYLQALDLNMLSMPRGTDAKETIVRLINKFSSLCAL